MSQHSRQPSKKIAPLQRRGTYFAALLALGLAAALAPAQAINPANTNGTTPAPPDAVVPGPPATTLPSALPPAPSPVPAVPAAPATPAVPAAPATPAAPETPAVPATPATPAAPATPATPETPALPTTPPALPTPPAPATPPAPPLTVTPPPPGPATTAAATQSDGPVYPITQLKINYYKEAPKQPPIDQLLKTDIQLGVSADGYTAPHPGGKTVTLQLGDIGKQGPQKIYRSGIKAIYEQIVRYYNKQGIIGVLVVVDVKDINESDRDVRPPDRTSLQFIVVLSHVHEIRTLATGNVNGGNRVDLPQHRYIIDHSPIQPDTGNNSKASPPANSMDLLNRNVLDDYVFRLNRQPGRRVDVAVSGSDKPGEVDLDYLVSENRPWYVYTQVSNTGTKQTEPWRERFGFVDNQLTGHDDILSVDYLTAGFTKSHALVGSYEFPVMGFDRLRDKVYITYNQFTASDVGQNNEQFTGEEWTTGDELALNIFQHRELFIDAVAGFRYQEVATNDQTTGVAGLADYFVPYGGLRLIRATDIATTSGDVTVFSYNTNASADAIQGLGRSQPSRNPTVLQFNAAQSLYLEPILFPHDFLNGKSTLANEAYLSVHGQYAFDNRLFPQAEDVAGGFYTVRGYPESIIAGDSVIVATGEYRLHIPRLFPVQPDPSQTPFLWDKSFRFSPSQTYGRPDWVLITRAFMDVGEVVNSDRLSFEENATLLGTGVGLEVQYKQYLNIRVDWGVALTSIPGLVDAGSNRFHISMTLLY